MGTKQYAATSLVAKDGFIVGLAKENEAGYVRLRLGPWEEEAEAQQEADEINAQLGHSKKRALMIVTSSMFPMSEAEHAVRRAEWPK